MIVWTIFLPLKFILNFMYTCILESELQVEIKLFCQNLCWESSKLSLCVFILSATCSWFHFLSSVFLCCLDLISNISFQRVIVNKLVVTELFVLISNWQTSEKICNCKIIYFFENSLVAFLNMYLNSFRMTLC